MNEEYTDRNIDEERLVKKYPLSDAEKDGTLESVCSTYSKENQIISDGIGRPGPKVFTLAPIIKQKVFPLPKF